MSFLYFKINFYELADFVKKISQFYGILKECSPVCTLELAMMILSAFLTLKPNK